MAASLSADAPALSGDSRTITIRRIALAGAWLALCAALAFPLSRLTFESDVWLAPDHPQKKAMDFLAERFQPGEALILAVQFPNSAINDQAFADLRALEQSLKQALGPDLISVRSTLSAQRISSHDDVVEVETFDEAYKRGAFPSLADFRKAFDDSPYGGRLLSKDGRIAALRLYLDTRDQAQRRARVMAVIDKTLRLSPFAEERIHKIGSAPLNNALNRIAYAELPRLLLVGLLAIAVFLRLALGSLSRTLPVLGLAILASALLLSVMAILGHSVNIIALALPILVSVIAVADALHILAHHDDVRARHGEASLAQLFRAVGARIWMPCLLTSMTSAIGFGAFAISDLIPLERFGIDAFIAILLLYPLAMTLSASSLYLLRSRLAKPQSRKTPIIPRFLHLCHRLTSRHPRALAAIASFLALFLILGLTQLRTETNFLNVFFDEESRIRKDFALADARLGGSGSIDLVLRAPKPGYFESLAALRQIRAQDEALRENPNVLHSETYAIALGEAHRALAGKEGYPDEKALLAQELLFLELSRSENRDDVLSPYADFTYESARLHLSTPDLSSGKLSLALADLAERIAPLRQGLETLWTGFGVFIHTLSTQVLKTQLESFAITILLIALIFLARFGFRAGVAGLLANLLPVGATVGLIAWLGVPFDFATVLIAGITLGLCVDDTLHFLHAYHRRDALGSSLEEARRHAIFLCGSPIIITTFLFSLGLAILFASSLVVLQRFALFTIFGLVMALLSTLFFLPSLLALAAPRAPAKNHDFSEKIG